MTLACDFDGVIHQYSKGWHDGTIYDPPMPGALDGLRALMEHHAVFIHTTRDLEQVAEWLTRRGFICCTEHHGPFWNLRGTLLVTNRKLAATAYLDDRAVRFTTWDQALADLDIPARCSRGLTGDLPLAVDPADAHRHAAPADVALTRARCAITAVRDFARQDEEEPGEYSDGYRQALAELRIILTAFDYLDDNRPELSPAVPGDTEATVPTPGNTGDQTSPTGGGHAHPPVPLDERERGLTSGVPERPRPQDTGDTDGDGTGDTRPDGVQFAYRATVRRDQVRHAIAEAFDLLSAELATDPHEEETRRAL